MNDMWNVRPSDIRCNHNTWIIIHHARSLTRAHIQSCTVMYMSTGRFLHSPGHDCIFKSVRSGQYCMADTIASDTGTWYIVDGIMRKSYKSYILQSNRHYYKIAMICLLFIQTRLVNMLIRHSLIFNKKFLNEPYLPPSELKIYFSESCFLQLLAIDFDHEYHDYQFIIWSQNSSLQQPIFLKVCVVPCLVDTCAII